MNKNPILFIALLVCTGCNFAPKFETPITEVPLDWKAENIFPCDTPCVDYWWEIFEDPYLNCLEWQAIQNNPTLQIGIQRVYEERSMAGLRKAELYPTLKSDSFYYNEAFLSSDSIFPSQASTALMIPKSFRTHQVFYDLSFNLRYELDLWGKFRNQYQAALYSAEAQQNALQSTWLSITTDLASNYYQLRSLDTQLEILKNTISTRKIAVEVNEKRYKGSLVNYTDVSRAQVLLHNAEAEYFNTLRKRVLKENLIAVLLGIPASNFHIPCLPLKENPPTVPAGIPSEVLLRRPDILEAEKRIAMENSTIGAAYASFFPTFKLTGDIGYFSMDFKDFLTWKSRLWDYGAATSFPIFDGFNSLSNLEVAQTRFKMANSSYQEKVLEAFQDVEDALVNLQMQKEEMLSLEKSAEAALETTRLSQKRYLHGVANYLDVVDSERTELETKRSLADLLGWRYVSTIQLIKAIGGCWD
jgi:multidrug efflux system outer membrane protein